MNEIAALTARMGSDFEQQCLGSGMDGCMFKLFSAAQRLEILQRYIGHLAVIKRSPTDLAFNQELNRTQRLQAIVGQ